jgi:hypothetical protein
MKTMQRAGNVFTTPFDDAILMLNASKSRYHSLNPVAARVWELLEKPMSQEALVDALVEEYEVTRQTCAEQVAVFLAALRERSLIVETG